MEVGAASDDIKHTLEVMVGPYTPKKITSSLSNRSKKAPVGQQMKISGTVRDVQANPIERVSVCSAYSGKELAFTDHKGQYSLKAATDDELIFKCNGYVAHTVSVDGNAAINVKLSVK